KRRTLTTHVVVRRPGDGGVKSVIDLPGVYDEFIPSPNGAAVFLTPRRIGELSGTGPLLRTDGSYPRDAPWSFFAGYQYDADGEWLFSMDSDFVVRAHSTRASVDQDIGNWGRGTNFPLPDINIDDDRQELNLCDVDGLRVIPFQLGPTRVLD